MQTLVKVNDKKWGFTFRTFYGRWQNKKAKAFIELMAKNGIEAEII